MYLNTRFPTILFFLFATFTLVLGQNKVSVRAVFNEISELLEVTQSITFFNDSKNSLDVLVLNDWNYAYANNKTPLAYRFSDEFVRNFHLSKKSEKSFTSLKSIKHQEKTLNWCRFNNQEDVIEVKLNQSLLPNESIIIELDYSILLPHKKFTGFGRDKHQSYYYKNSLIVPSKMHEDNFVSRSFLNIDDNASVFFDADVEIKFPNSYFLFSDLEQNNSSQIDDQKVVKLQGSNLNDINFVLSKNGNFKVHKNPKQEVVYNFKDKRLNVIQKAIIIDKIINYTDSVLGKYPAPKIMVTQEDYDKNPFYGLNQLPSFIRPFSDEFVFEIKFLKTYINTFLKNKMQLDQRVDNWLFDAIQVYCMMDYINKFYPDEMMLGNISSVKLLKGYHLANLKFNEQYSYYYLLMARRNQDQAVGENKEELLKFNEQIAGKYRAGLSLKYLDDYLGNSTVNNTIKDFFLKSTQKQTSEKDFIEILQTHTDKDISWFFETIIHSRDIIDFKIKKLTNRKNDTINVHLKNKTKSHVPVPLYTIKNKQINSKQWLFFDSDTIVKIANNEIDKVVLNYENEVPEINQRNNWKATKGFLFNNRPLKIALVRDLESPYHNQALLIPSFSYNAYNGISLGMRLHNKTFLDKPFRYVINPEYAFGTNDLNGGFSFEYNQVYRNSNWFNSSYFLSGRMSNFAQDAKFFRFSPAAVFRWRNPDFRKNHSQNILARYINIRREASEFVEVTDQTVNYSLLNLRYSNFYDELISRKIFWTDLQLADIFGKLSMQAQYRKLYSDNRLLSLRFYAGAFLYRNTTSEFFSFGLDRPTDYLFDLNFLGVSETTGLLSQQFIMSEGGFKSFLNTRYANQWLSTFNASYSIWSWIEAYTDIGLLKNQYASPEFVYDSGIRLNFLPDYFELYFPIYSSNGWEVSQKNYAERIRFVVTLEPSRLMSLFTRKWF